MVTIHVAGKTLVTEYVRYYYPNKKKPKHTLNLNTKKNITKLMLKLESVESVTDTSITSASGITTFLPYVLIEHSMR